jgi:hypothetical protein
MSIENRINKLFEAIGDGKLFAGATMEDLAKFGFLTQSPKRQVNAPHNVRKLAACAGAWCKWAKLKRTFHTGEQATELERIDLQPYASLDDTRDRIIEICRESDFNDAEMAFLEKRLKMPSANVA